MFKKLKVNHTISKNLFYGVLEELNIIAKQRKATIKIIKKPPMEDPQFESNNVTGECVSETRQITITTHGIPDDVHVLFVLAHEIRHILHKHYGMFGNYYKRNRDIGIFSMVEENFKAEIDCDRFAVRWLKARGVEASAYVGNYDIKETRYGRYVLFLYKNTLDVLRKLRKLEEKYYGISEN